MEFRFSKKLWVLALLVIIALGASVIYKQGENKRREIVFGNRPYVNATVDKTSPIDWLVLNNIAGLTESFDRLVKQGIFTRNDLGKLDFSQEGDPEYGENPDWGVYTPQSRLFPNGKGGTAVPPWIMEELTGDKNARAVFNLRRHTRSDGTVVDTLYLIIPNVRKEECHRYYNYLRNTADEPIKHIDTALDIPPDNHSLVLDSFDIPAIGRCIQPQDKRIHLFLPFYGRPATQGE